MTTQWIYSVAGICPIDVAADGDRLAWAMGWQTDPNEVGPLGPVRTFRAPSGPTEDGAASYYGFAGKATQQFVDLLQSAGQGILPPLDWTEFGLTTERIMQFLTAARFMVVHQDSADPRDLYDALLADNALVRVRENLA